MKDMNRSRRNVARDETTRMVHSHRHSDTDPWLRTLREIRGLPEIARPT